MIFSVIILFYLTNFFSYQILKNKTLKSRRWDLNICCGNTDGGGVNADIVKHSEVPAFVLINDITNLPFKDKQFDYTLCSHTIEHVDNPAAFYNELCRVSRNLVIVVPPLWDITAALNIFEHKWLFLTLHPNHNVLPLHIKLPFATHFQRIWGQKIKA
ncbi:MAG: methyltransferase domain-containing protein [Candidatus Cloacimonetes bacterium]|nr:methyltransferase domain-containing protein [Candidatus Cloacimonadota bacterium]